MCFLISPAHFRLIVVLINSFPPLVAPLTSRLIVALIRHVIYASIVPDLLSGGDYLHRGIVGSLVGGHGGGCAKGGGTINEANNADGSADVREGYGGVWW